MKGQLVQLLLHTHILEGVVKEGHPPLVLECFHRPLLVPALVAADIALQRSLLFNALEFNAWDLLDQEPG